MKELPPGQPVTLIHRPGRAYVAVGGPGPLLTLWTMNGIIIADRGEVTVLDEPPDPEALKRIAIALLLEIGSVLGAEEVLRLAQVQAGR